MYMRFFQLPAVDQTHEQLGTPGLTLPLQETVGSRDFDPFEFVTNQSKQLNSSSELWRAVGRTIRELKDPRIFEAVSQGLSTDVIRDLKQAGGHPTVQEVILINSERIARQLPGYLLLSARYHADLSRNTDPEPADKFRRRVFEIEDLLIGDISLTPGFPGDKLNSLYDRLSNDMAKADGIGGNVVGDLVESVQSPDDLINLAELYEAGIGNQEPAFVELREMIRTDWLKPRKTKSILRAYIDSLHEQPDIFVEDFSRAILESGKNRLRREILEMARFAIAARKDQSATNESEAIIKVLADTRPSWSQFDKIEEAFKIFASEQVVGTEKAITLIANGFSGRNIRIPSTQKEISELNQQMRIVIEAPSRQSKRAGRRKEAKVGALDVERIAEKIDKPPAPEIHAAEIASGSRLVLPSDLSTGQILAAFKRLGFETIPGGGKGNHQKIHNPNTGKRTTVSKSMGRIPLKSLLRQAGVSDEEFLNKL